ncbi:hypothetical protein FRC03_002019 [Tulasnella sp. 419]|nr:hypothetical protein FRC03_002019 [Tulasnella sp. 419]
MGLQGHVYPCRIAYYSIKSIAWNFVKTITQFSILLRMSPPLARLVFTSDEQRTSYETVRRISSSSLSLPLDLGIQEATQNKDRISLINKAAVRMLRAKSGLSIIGVP